MNCAQSPSEFAIPASETDISNHDFFLSENNLRPKTTYATNAFRICISATCLGDLPNLCAANQSPFNAGRNIMALIDTGRTSGQTPAFAASLRGGLTGLLVAFADWNDQRRTRRVLSQLSSHELDDIGLTRGDIDAIARQRRF